MSAKRKGWILYGPFGPDVFQDKGLAQQHRKRLLKKFMQAGVSGVTSTSFPTSNIPLLVGERRTPLGLGLLPFSPSHFSPASGAST